MPKEKESGAGNESTEPVGRPPFVTIDDLVQQAETLTTGLRTLSEYKHPLDVRRGVKGKGVEQMAADSDSITVKAGARTYFLDLKETKEEQTPFLIITESRFKGEGEERERSSIMVFPENAAEFAEAVSAMAARLE